MKRQARFDVTTVYDEVTQQFLLDVTTLYNLMVTIEEVKCHKSLQVITQ